MSQKNLINNTIVIVPCYNADKTIEKVINQILGTGFDNIIIGDDCSQDLTINIVQNKFPKVKIIKNSKRSGYGSNQKMLFKYAIENNYKYIVMIHGDNQYTPKLIPSLINMIYFSKFDLVFGSRILGGNAIKGGMPIYKYIANRALTFIQNIATQYKLSEYHSGLRAFNVKSLMQIKFNNYSNNFIFDNQLMLGFMELNFKIGEISCETIYTHESSSINLKSSIYYGLGVLKETILFIFKKFK